MRPIKELIEQFQKLPSVGPKMARRFVYFLINKNDGRYLNDFENALREVKEKIGICKKCFNIAEGDLCSICDDSNRDHQTICIVEEALDIIPIEESGGFNGIYHVLGGSINPTMINKNSLQDLYGRHSIGITLLMDWVQLPIPVKLKNPNWKSDSFG